MLLAATQLVRGSEIDDLGGKTSRSIFNQLYATDAVFYNLKCSFLITYPRPVKHMNVNQPSREISKYFAFAASTAHHDEH